MIWGVGLLKEKKKSIRLVHDPSFIAIYVLYNHNEENSYIK